MYRLARIAAVALLGLTAPGAVRLPAVSIAAQDPAAPDPAPRSRQSDIFYVPTRQSVADAMLQLAQVTNRDTVVDLGSGDGRIVILAAQKYGARGTGIEIDPALVARSREAAHEGLVDKQVTFVEGDLFDADLTRATVVTLFLTPGINRRLLPKLQRELPDGARIVSHQFRIGSWQPDRIVNADDGTRLYLWTVRRP